LVEFLAVLIVLEADLDMTTNQALIPVQDTGMTKTTKIAIPLSLSKISKEIPGKLDFFDYLYSNLFSILLFSENINYKFIWK